MSKLSEQLEGLRKIREKQVEARALTVEYEKGLLFEMLQKVPEDERIPLSNLLGRKDYLHDLHTAALTGRLPNSRFFKLSEETKLYLRLQLGVVK